VPCACDQGAVGSFCTALYYILLLRECFGLAGTVVSVTVWFAADEGPDRARRCLCECVVRWEYRIYRTVVVQLSCGWAAGQLINVARCRMGETRRRTASFAAFGGVGAAAVCRHSAAPVSGPPRTARTCGLAAGCGSCIAMFLALQARALIIPAPRRPAIIPSSRPAAKAQRVYTNTILDERVVCVTSHETMQSV